MKKLLFIITAFTLLVSCQTSHRKPSSEDEVLQISTLPIESVITFNKQIDFSMDNTILLFRIDDQGNIYKDQYSVNPGGNAGTTCRFQVQKSPGGSRKKLRFNKGSRYKISSVDIFGGGDEEKLHDPNQYGVEYRFVDSNAQPPYDGHKFSMVCSKETIAANNTSLYRPATKEETLDALNKIGINFFHGSGPSVVNVPTGVQVEPIKYQAPQQNSATPVEI